MRKKKKNLYILELNKRVMVILMLKVNHPNMYKIINYAPNLYSRQTEKKDCIFLELAYKSFDGVCN